MPKSLTLGNGNILVGFDAVGQVNDFYFPYIGVENQAGEPCVHKIGAWIDNKLYWLDDGTWNIQVNCKKETFAGIIYASHRETGIELEFTDVVYNEKNIFVRSVLVKNKSKKHRAVKMFFHAGFELYSSDQGDTAYFDPNQNAIIHYKGRRVFLTSALCEGKYFDDYSIGIFGIEKKEGTYKDAEDGTLSKNPVEHGKVDSVIGVSLDLVAGTTKMAYYWITAGETHKEAHDLHAYVYTKTPAHLIQTTEDYWHAWVNKKNWSFYELSEKVSALFKKSLFYIRAHSDNRGAIIASGDSDMLQYGRDTYSYMWPRDGSVSAIALDRAGDTHVAERFFKFCDTIIEDDGYFLHKYRADESWGSSWHPWIRDGQPTLPIQEDETALVIEALWTHYELSKDIEFIESLYNSLIKKAADFMVKFRDKETGLPLPSYDLWEEKFGITTFTSGAVYGALIAASKFARLLGKDDEAKIYTKAAEEIQKGILKYLYDESSGCFHKLILKPNEKSTHDSTLDISSIYGVFRFNVLPVDDARVKKAMEILKERICCKTAISGFPRYEGDAYYRVDSSLPGNPWFITTLWYAQYVIKQAKKKEDLGEVKRWLEWVVEHALPSGVLSEQLHPHTGAQISAAPLTWSHSEFVITVIEYLQKLETMGICVACLPKE